MTLLKKKQSINLDEAIEASTPLGITKTSNYYHILDSHRGYPSCLHQDLQTVADDLKRVFVFYEALNHYEPVYHGREHKTCSVNEIRNTPRGDGECNAAEKFWNKAVCDLQERTVQEQLTKKLKWSKSIKEKFLEQMGYKVYEDGSSTPSGCKFDKYAELYKKINR